MEKKLYISTRKQTRPLNLHVRKDCVSLDEIFAHLISYFFLFITTFIEIKTKEYMKIQKNQRTKTRAQVEEARTCKIVTKNPQKYKLFR